MLTNGNNSTFRYFGNSRCAHDRERRVCRQCKEMGVGGEALCDAHHVRKDRCSECRGLMGKYIQWMGAPLDGPVPDMPPSTRVYVSKGIHTSIFKQNTTMPDSIPPSELEYWRSDSSGLPLEERLPFYRDYFRLIAVKGLGIPMVDEPPAPKIVRDTSLESVQEGRRYWTGVSERVTQLQLAHMQTPSQDQFWYEGLVIYSQIDSHAQSMTSSFACAEDHHRLLFYNYYRSQPELLSPADAHHHMLYWQNNTNNLVLAGQCLEFYHMECMKRAFKIPKPVHQPPLQTDRMSIEELHVAYASVSAASINFKQEWTKKPAIAPNYNQAAAQVFQTKCKNVRCLDGMLNDAFTALDTELQGRQDATGGWAVHAAPPAAAPPDEPMADENPTGGWEVNLVVATPLSTDESEFANVETLDDLRPAEGGFFTPPSDAE